MEKNSALRCGFRAKSYRTNTAAPAHIETRNIAREISTQIAKEGNYAKRASSVCRVTFAIVSVSQDVLLSTRKPAKTIKTARQNKYRTLLEVQLISARLLGYSAD